MSLAAEAERLRADRIEAQNRCPVGKLRLTLSETDRTELDFLMAKSYDEMPTAVIIDALKSSGTSVSFNETPMQSHRRAMHGGTGCKCQV